MLPRPHQDLAAVAFLTTLWYLQVKFITSQRLYLPYNIYVPHNIWRGHKPRPVLFNLKLVVQCFVLEETFIIADTIIAENKVHLHGREFSEVICQICFSVCCSKFYCITSNVPGMVNSLHDQQKHLRKSCFGLFTDFLELIFYFLQVFLHISYWNIFLEKQK